MERLLERERELVALEGALAAARDGRGRLVVVDAPAGLGKTSLLAAAATAAGERGLARLGARATELEGDLAYGCVGQLLEPRVARAADVERDRVFAGAAALAEPLFLPADRAHGRPADSGFPILHGLYWLLDNLASEVPLLLSIDDLHWADAASLRFLNYLAPRLDGLAVAVVVSVRSGDAGARRPELASLLAAPEATVLRPGPLSPEATATLCERWLGPGVSVEFGRACQEATGGNPFYLEALLREAADEGLPTGGAQADRVRRAGPAAVSRAILLRLSGRPPAAAALVRAIAVLGDGADLAEAAALAGLDEEEAGAAADLLAVLGILRPAARLEFAHPIVREAVYADIGPRQRAEAHARAARLLAGRGAAEERVAAQIMVAEPAGEPARVETLRRAARGALTRGAPAAAARYLSRALAEPPAPAERRAVLRELGLAEVQARVERGVEHLAAALELAAEPAERAALAQELALAHVHFLRQPEAVEVLRRELDGRAALPQQARLRLEAELASTLLFGMDEALAELDARLSRLAPELSADTPEGRRLLATRALRMAQSGEDAATVSRLAELVLERGLLDDVGPGSTAYFNAITTLILAGASDAARRWTREALRRSRASGFLLGMALNWNLISWEAYRRGVIPEAEASGADALRVVREHPMPIGHPAVIGSFVDALVARGESAAAWGELARDRLTDALPEVFTSAWLFAARGRLRALDGDHAGALADQLDAGERFRRWGVVGCAPSPWRSEAAEALVMLGRADEAARLAGEDLGLARAFGAPRGIGIALRALGLAEGGERGLARLDEAVAVLASSPARLEHARALVDLGAALRRANRRREARAPLGEGVALAERCGAHALAERGTRELSAAGARPRTPLRTGLEELTTAERRAAELAAEGRSNPEIAQALFVTRKTVETHLGSAYRKLGVSSRGAAPRRAADGRARRLSPA